MPASLAMAIIVFSSFFIIFLMGVRGITPKRCFAVAVLALAVAFALPYATTPPGGLPPPELSFFVWGNRVFALIAAAYGCYLQWGRKSI